MSKRPRRVREHPRGMADWIGVDVEKRICSEPDCDKPVLARKMCSAHYNRAWRRPTFVPLATPSEWHRLTEIDKGAGTAMCSKCGPTSIRLRNDGRGAECKVKRKQRQAAYRSQRARHRIPPEQWAALPQECAICGATESLCVDHDHVCCPGKTSCGRCVRGLLCRHCNFALGYFRDDAQRIFRALSYLGG